MVLLSTFLPVLPITYIQFSTFAECGEANFENGVIKGISDDGRLLTITCDYGCEADEVTFECLNGSWVNYTACILQGIAYFAIY